MSDKTPRPSKERFSAAATRFFPDVSSIEPVETSDSIARVETPFGAFALRRWPPGTTRERVNFVHAVLANFAELLFVPHLFQTGTETIVEADQHLYDATTWLEGKPLRRAEWRPGLSASVSLPRAGSVELIEAITAATAQMHVASKSLAEKRGSQTLPINALIAGVRASWMQQRGRLRPVAHLTPDIQRWLRTGERSLPLAERIIASLPEDAMGNLVVAHANLWPDHILIEREGRDDRLSGVLDFKQAVATTPLVDLAQIAGRFNGWSDETAEIVIGAYVELGHLTPPERRVLPAIAALDLIAESGRILVAAYVELGSSYAPSSMRSAADTMLRSLESVTKTMERLEGINQPGPRKWVHRTPRPGQPKPEKRPRQRRPKDSR